MLRKIRLIVLLSYYVIIYIYTINGQSLFNLEFHKDFGCTGIDLLYEDSSYYYAIGYAQAKDKVEVGVMVNKHDKKSGALKHSAYFDVENVWLDFCARPRVIQKNNNLYFCLSGTNGVVYIVNYNIMTQDITVRESIITKSGFVYDLVEDDEGNMYCSYTTKDNDNKVQGAVTKLRIDGTKSHYTIDNKGMIHTGGKLIRNDKGTWYFIAQWLPSFNDNYLVVAEMDSAFNILWTWRSPWADRIFGVRDVLSIDNDQVLILAIGVTYDSIYKEEAFVDWVYRYDLKERKVLWRRNYGHPPSSIITPGCRVVASQRDEDTWLMCTTAVLAGSTREHYVIAGRVAKFNADGDTLWAKDYVLYKDEHLDRNRFVTMIPTMDGNYLLGGFYLGDGCRSWLVKIDEDGNIVPRDTTSSLADFAPVDSTQSLRVYPNPASDKIEVHYTSGNGDEVGGYTLSVKNVSGREVYNIYTRSATNQIPVSDLAAGVYYVSVVIAGQVRKTVRFIKVQ